MQNDGNFVQYTANNKAVWFSKTDGNTGARLVAQDDGNLVIYSSANRPLWNIGADNSVSASPQQISEVVGRDLLIPGASWAGHIGLWNGSSIIEAMSGQPLNAIRLSTVASFKNAALENNYTYWGVSSPNIPAIEIQGCFDRHCTNFNFQPEGQVERTTLRLSIAKRAYQSYLIGADYTMTATYTPTNPGNYYNLPTRGIYRCDTFIIDSYKVVKINSPLDWEARLSTLSATPVLPKTVFERLKSL